MSTIDTTFLSHLRRCLPVLLLATGAILEDGGIVLQYDGKGCGAEQVLPYFDFRDLRNLRGNGSPVVRRTGNGGYLIGGYTAIDLGEQEGALHSQHNGAILVNYDLRFQHAEFWRSLWYKNFGFAVAAFFLIALVTWLVRRLGIRPSRWLTKIAGCIGLGESGAGAGSAGSGEMAMLGRVFSRKSGILPKIVKTTGEREQRLAIVLNSIGDGVIATDPKGCVMYSNAVAAGMTGWTEAEAMERPIEQVFRILNSRTGEPVDNPVAEVLETRATVELGNHVLLIARNDRKYRIAGSVAPIRDSQDRVLGVVLVFRDVTREYRVRDALQFRQYGIEYSLDSIFWMNAEGRLLDVNRGACGLLGYSRDELLGMMLHEIDSNCSLVDWERHWAELRKHSHRRFETRYRCKDGQFVPVEVTDNHLVYKKKEFNCAVIRDLTDRKRLEQAMRAESSRNAMLLKTASDGIHILDEHGCVVQASDAFCRMLGYTQEEIVGMHASEWDAQLTRAELNDKVGELLNGAAVFETRHRRRGGSVFDVEVSVTGVLIGNRRLLFCSSRDISQSKQAELELRLAASTFEANEAILITGANGVIQRVNRAYCRTTGYSPEEVIGRKPSIVKSGLHDEGFYRDLWQALHRDEFWEGEIWNRRKSGEIFPEWLCITAVKNEAGETTHYVGSYMDLTRQKEAEEKVRQLAYYDTLTGLPNRRLLYDRLQRAFTAAARLGQYGALLFIDLDNFKILNDTAGHDVGDQLLVQVAETLTRTVRTEDTVARLGGDEFVVVLERLGKEEVGAAARAGQVAEKVIGAVRKPYTFATVEYHVTLSIGVALFCGEEERPESFLKRADAAMYQAKAAGRNTACFFDPQMAAAMADRVSLLADLRRARMADQFHLHCQPVVDREGRLAGGEILLRWKHPERGWIAPAEFIPLAEESGLITEIGTWMLGVACNLIRRWEDAGLLAPNFFLSVNISSKQLHQPDFTETVRHMVEQAGMAAHRLKFEITEGMLISRLVDIIATLGELRTLGVRFSLDDFGTGYSSLACLQQLPLDQLKIDRSFIRDVPEDANDAVIVKTVISMGRNLRLEVVGEGVETSAQFEFLKAHGCDMFQGHLFGRPAELADFERRLREAAAVGRGARDRSGG